MTDHKAIALQEDSTNLSPPAQESTRNPAVSFSTRYFSRRQANIRLTATALIGFVIFATHAHECYEYWTVPCVILLFCLINSNSTKQTIARYQTRTRSASLKGPNHRELFYFRADLGDYQYQTPDTPRHTPFYVKRLRLVHRLNKFAGKDKTWRFDDPEFLDECRYVWEVVHGSRTNKPDAEGYRFVDFP